LLHDVITPLKKQFTAGATTELRSQRNLNRRVVIQGGRIVANTRQEQAGVNARVNRGGVYGFASAANLSKEGAQQVLKDAARNAEVLARHQLNPKGAMPAIQQGLRPVDPDMVDLPQQYYIDYLKELDNYIAKKYPGLASRTVVSSCDSMEKLLVTSDGYSAHTIAPRGYVYVILTQNTKDGVPVDMFEAFGGRGTFDKNFIEPSTLHEKIDQVYENLMKKTEGVYAEAGVKTVILNGMMAGMLAHEAVGHTVEADLVLAGSVAGPMLGKQVASPLISLTDFAHTAFGQTAPLPVYVDDEGVKDGILTGYMVNRELGEKFGMEPKGNARAWAFSDEPLIRMRNTVILPGKDKLEDMVASIDDGYYLIHSGNGQADATGEFMFGVTMGYEIKNGKLGKALLDTTVSGVAFDMLKSVSMVSDKMYWSSSGFCGKKQPMSVSMGGPDIKCQITIGGR
jgi:TldD protein